MKRVFLIVMFLATMTAFGEKYSSFIESCGQDHSGGGVQLGTRLDPDAEKVAAIFQQSCVGCHSAGSPSGPFGDIMDVDELMKKGIIDPVSPTQSRLYKSLNRPAGWMPLGKEPLSIEEKNQIIKWMGKNSPQPPPKLVDDGPVNPDLPIISYEDEVACIFRDLIRAVNENDREFTRYLTLSNVSNLQKKKEFAQLQQAVQKLLNSVSYNARLTKAGKVDEYGVIYRFDLRDFNLVAADFDNLVAVGQYPYALKRFDDDDVGFFEQAIAEFTENDKTISFIRADWFVFTASQPPIYHDLLKIPKTKDELLALLNIDQQAAFEDEEAKRSGIRFSGVTNFPRLVDYYELEIGIGSFQYDGQLWTTYDFDNDNLATSNIFANPFGPVDFFANNEDLDTDKEFIHQAEEWIYSLPNGLSAYVIFDGNGNRVDFAATQVAFDPDNNGPGFLGNTPTEIVNGVSCMGCHATGMNLYTDIIRDHVQYTVGFNSQEADFARDNFFEPAELRKTLLQYVSDFTQSQKTVGVINQVSKATEPIYNQARYYNDLVDACELGAEFYLDCRDAKARLARDPQLAIELGYSADGSGSAPRDTIDDRFNDIAVSFNIGEQILFDANGKAPKCELVAEKNVVFQGDIVRFVIDVIGKADIVKINGIKVKKDLKIQFKKAGLQKIVGVVANQFGAFKCFAEVLVKKKKVGHKPPTCEIETNKDVYKVGEYIRVKVKPSHKVFQTFIQGHATPGGSGVIFAGKAGKLKINGKVKSDKGEGKCSKFVTIKKGF